MNFFRIINKGFAFLLILFFPLLLISFAVPAEELNPVWFEAGSDFLESNWVVIGLVLSEVAAFLPGKPKGIIQAIVGLGNKLFTGKRSR